MNGILQGTTPKLVISIPDNVPLSSVNAIELMLVHKGAQTIVDMTGVTVDTEANTITYQFTEAQTLALDPRGTIVWQLRLKSDTNIVGTRPGTIRIYDLISEEAMA